MKFIYCDKSLLEVDRNSSSEKVLAQAKSLISETILNRASVQNCCFVFMDEALTSTQMEQITRISDDATDALGEVVDSPPIHPLAIIGNTLPHILLVRGLIDELHALCDRREPIAVSIFEKVSTPDGVRFERRPRRSNRRNRMREQYSRVIRGIRHVWDIDKLRSELENIQPVDWEIPSSFQEGWSWGQSHPSDHIDSCLEADLSYPIIVWRDMIIDGCHRVVKALAKGQKTIKAIIIINLPLPNEVTELDPTESNKGISWTYRDMINIVMQRVSDIEPEE